jgi:hypothetical protein
MHGHMDVKKGEVNVLFGRGDFDDPHQRCTVWNWPTAISFIYLFIFYLATLSYFVLQIKMAIFYLSII